jgi:hypothetical protein
MAYLELRKDGHHCGVAVEAEDHNGHRGQGAHVEREELHARHQAGAGQRGLQGWESRSGKSDDTQETGRTTEEREGSRGEGGRSRAGQRTPPRHTSHVTPAHLRAAVRHQRCARQEAQHRHLVGGVTRTRAHTHMTIST